LTRVAAIDCGTNSIRLLVADRTGDGKADVRREMRINRLGQDVDRTGVLAPEALERTAQALQEYGVLCAELGVEATRLVATSATRDATNSADFVALVQQSLGIAPDIISGAEEAALAFVGATAGLAEPGPYLVIDIGGGSTELVLGTAEVEAACSMDIGCVRVTERHLRDDPPTLAQQQAAAEDVRSALEGALAVVPAREAVTFLGLAGSVTTVAALVHQLTSYEPERIHHSRLSLDDVARVARELLAMDRAERASLPVMHPGRVDVIGAGALILSLLMERIGITDLLVSETDILDGIALSMRP